MEAFIMAGSAAGGAVMAIRTETPPDEPVTGHPTAGPPCRDRQAPCGEANAPVTVPAWWYQVR
jgi:hypothetical protein